MRVLGTLSALLLSLAFAFIVSWQLISSVNFAYPVWYQVLEIDKTIAKYGPHNQFKRDFELTSQALHLQLFEQISEAIELPLEKVKPALQAIQYGNAQQPIIDFLLHESEVQHLYDVAVLLSNIKILSLLLILVFSFVLFSIYRLSQKTNKLFMLKISNVYYVMLALLVMAFTGIALIGFEPVFYQLHEWVFPKKHQWFFYYEESLMSTLMQAPNLFAYIGGLLLVVMLMVQFFVVFALQRVLSSKWLASLLTANENKHQMVES